jgi:hypothetical protein
MQLWCAQLDWAAEGSVLLLLLCAMPRSFSSTHTQMSQGMCEAVKYCHLCLGAPDFASWMTAFCTGMSSLSSSLSFRPSSRRNSLQAAQTRQHKP